MADISSQPPWWAMGTFMIGAAWVYAAAALPLELPRPNGPPHPPTDRGPALPADRNAFAQVEAAVDRAFPPADDLPRALGQAGELPEALGPAPPLYAQLIADQGPLMADLHAARAAPGFQIRPGRPQLDEPQPRYNAITVAAGIAALRYRERARAGDVAGGLPGLVDALWLGRRLVAEPGGGLLGVYVGSMITRRAVAAAHRDGGPLFRAPAPVLAGLAADLAPLAAFQLDLADTLAVERDAALAALRDSRGEGLLTGGLMGALSKWTIRPSLPAIERAYDAYIEAAVARDRHRLAAIDAACRPPGDDVRAFLDFVLHPIDAAAAGFVNQLLVATETDTLLCDEARFRGLVAEVAIARYRQAHGRPPAALADLVPAYLPAPPEDPFAPGRPLRWAGGKLWSVGPDGKDDGGRLLPDARLQPKLELELGDLRLIPATYRP